jgi:hypothetical protein
MDLESSQVKLAVVAHSGLLAPSAGARPHATERRDLEFAAAGVTVAEVLQTVGLDGGTVGVMIVRGRPVTRVDTLAVGTQLDLYPFFGGG